MYYLCEKECKLIMVQHYIASCVGWVSRPTFLDLQTKWTYKCALGRELVCMQENYYSPAQARARSPQSCPTLCDPMGHNMPAVCPWDSPASILEWREQDGRGVGGHGVHLSPRICQEYNFRHKSAWTTPAESGLEYLTRGKEYIEPCKTWDQALSLWRGSPGSKTLDYQRTNPMKYQIMRNHTNETTWIQEPASPNHQQHSVKDASSKQQTKQKYKSNHQQTGLPTHSALPIRGKTSKQNLSTNLTLYKACTNQWTNLRRAETKRKKEFNLEVWEKETSNTIS